MSVDIGLSPKQLEGSITLLNRVLADEFILYVKVRKYHWNVKGIYFNDLHKFFQSLYEDLDNIVDSVAERVRAVGGDAVGTIAEYVNLTRLPEEPGNYPVAKDMIANLVTLHEILIKEIRVDVETCQNILADVGTADFLTGIMEIHEKSAWMLRSMISE